jgi:hypothetical protein
MVFNTREEMDFFKDELHETMRLKTVNEPI